MAASAFFISLAITSLCCISPSQEACPKAYPVLTGDPSLPDESLSASSIYADKDGVVRGLGPHASRLRSTSYDQAWAAVKEPSVGAEYIQVDLGHVNRVAAIATQGRANADMWVKQYYIRLSNDGSVFHNYTDNGIVKLFTGNTDRDTVVNHTLQDTPEARYVRLYPTQWTNNIIALRWEVYICSACLTPHPLLSGDPRVPDDSFLASSRWNDEAAPRYSRLNSDGWAAQHSRAGEYIQVDLMALRTVHSIATQGRSTDDHWITLYYVTLSKDGVNFKNYNENAKLKTLTGNADSNTVVRHLLHADTQTRYVRLYPTQWAGHIALRWEIYSCPADLICTTVHPVLSGDPRLPGASLSATSNYDWKNVPSRSRLHTEATDGYAGAWVARLSEPGQYIQLDLGAFSMLHSIATQGRQEHNEWVKEYYLMFSEDGTNFYDYRQNGVRKMFSANRDHNTVVRHHLLHFKPVRYIRLFATKWKARIALRWDMYTCSNCLAGTYGRDCSLSCHCSGATPLCYEFSGQCVGDCHPGWYGDTCQIENKAFNKAATASNYNPPYIGAKAVDGSPSSEIASCFEAGNTTADQWLEVNLGQPVKVLRVWMLNRDAHAKRLQQVTVRIGNSSQSSGNQDLCFYHGTPDTAASNWLRGTCNTALTGQYVSVSRPHLTVGPLTICQLVVISETSRKPRPDAVRNLRLTTSQQATSATVSWDAPYWTHLALVNYRVSLRTEAKYCPLTSTTSEELNKTTKSSTHTFNNLQRGTKNVIDVTALTLSVEGGGDGEKRSTEEFDISDGQVDPNSIQVNATVTGVTSHSLTVTWSPPSCYIWGAPFKQYRVQLGTENEALIADTSNRTYIFDHLSAYKEYTVKVVFETTYTASTAVSVTNRTKPEKPGNPQSIHLVSNDLQWSAPEHLNGKLLHYSVIYKHILPANCSISSDSPTTVKANGTSVMLNDLLSGSLYEFSIATVTNWGQGEAETSQHWISSDATHKDNIKPGDLRVTQKTSTSLTLLWSAPLCGYWGSPLTSYSLDIYVLHNNAGFKSENNIKTTSFTVRGLSPYTGYNFRLYLNTERTRSNEAFVSNKTLPDKPGKPQTPALNEQQLSWTRPSVMNGTFRYYQITYTLRSVNGCDNRTVTLNENTTNTDITLSNLKSGSLYNISVVTVNIWGPGDPETITLWTPAKAPDPPRNLSGSLINATAATFYWDTPPCHKLRGTNISFQYFVTDQTDGSIIRQATTPHKNVTIDGVRRNSNYTLRVQLQASGGNSVHEISVFLREGIPGVPYGLVSASITESSFTISWGLPRETNGFVSKYQVNCTGTSGPTYPSSTTSHTETDLDTASNHTCSVQAATSKGFGPAKTIVISTLPKQIVPKSPTVEKSTNRTATFVIHEIDGPHLSYWLVAVEARSKRRRRQISPPQPPFPANSYITLNISALPPEGRVVVGDGTTSNNGVLNKPLKAGKFYSLHVAAVTVYGDHVVYGTVTIKEAFQAVVKDYLSKPFEPRFSVAPYVGAAVGALVLLAVPVVLLILWKRGMLPRRRPLKDNGDKADNVYSEVSTNVTSANVASSASEYAKPEEIRKKKKKSKKEDPPIYLNEIALEDRDPPDGESQPTNAQGPVYENINKQRKSKPALAPKPKQANPNPSPPSSPEPKESEYRPVGLSAAIGVPLDEFIQHVRIGKANNKKTFLEDYETLPQKLIKAATAGYLPKNKAKNRYRDIIPYDQTRVILKNHVTDYVNASHVVGYAAAQKYIAAQAPNKSSLADFLVLLWQEKVGVVIMLNNVFENGKKRCEEYWPIGDAEEVKALPIVVTMSREERRNHYTIRHLNLKHNNGETRTLKQYHYTGWPDFGVPAMTSGLVQLRNDVRKTHGDQLLLVHCSAGVGRTGSFISLDLLLQRGPRLPVLQTVELLRQQRSIMVQTIAQYVFLHDALAESLVGGQSSFSGHQFTAWVASRDFAEKSHAQYQVLELMVPPDAYYERGENAPASGMRRVEFTSSVSADVMNLGEVGEELWVVKESEASLETGELWQSVVRNGVTTVAVISSDKEKKEWTSVGQQKALSGGVTLECKSKQDVTLNLLRATVSVTSDPGDSQIYANVSAPSSGESGKVTVVQLTSPQSVSDLAALMQILVEGSKPLVFTHTTPSASVVAAATATVARARRLQEVDVYSTAKKVVLALPVLMPNLENYRLILRVAAEYLQLNSEYANFQ